MSIEKVRQFMEKSGCAIFVAIGVALVLVLGIVIQQCSHRAVIGKAQGHVVAAIGDYKITDNDLNQMESMARSNPQIGEATDPITQFATMGQALENLVDVGLTSYLIKENGIQFTDEQLILAITKSIDDQLARLKQQLVEQRKWKPEEADKELNKLFKEQTGKDIATLKKEAIDTAKKGLTDPTRRAAIVAKLGKDKLIDKYARSITVTDQDIKNEYTTLTLKYIFIKPAENGKESAKAIADKVLQEIKGGLSFEQAIDKYSKAPNFNPKKKLSDNSIPVPLSMLNQQPELKVLGTLKPGEVSGVISQGNTATIYKVIKSEVKLPPDFEKNKVKIQNDIAKQRAEAKYKEEIDKLKKSNVIKWDSEGYKLAYETLELRANPTLLANKKLLDQKFLEIAQKAASPNIDEVGLKAALLTRYYAIQQVWRSASPEEKSKLVDQRIDSIQMLLSKGKIENVKLRMELTNALLDKKDPGAGQSLVQAAELNNYIPGSEATNSQITDLLEKLKTAKLITPEQVKKVEEQQTRWKKEKTEYEAFEAEKRKKEEEERKKAETEQKKQQQGKVAPKPTTPTNTAVPTTAVPKPAPAKG